MRTRQCVFYLALLASGACLLSDRSDHISYQSVKWGGTRISYSAAFEALTGNMYSIPMSVCVCLDKDLDLDLDSDIDTYVIIDIDMDIAIDIDNDINGYKYKYRPIHSPIHPNVHTYQQLYNQTSDKDTR